MLQSIREKTSGWIASVLLGLIILTMAFFGVESYFSPKVETFSAKIEGPPKFWKFGGQVREISQDQFRRRFEQTRQQQRQAQGEEFDPAAFETLDNKRQVLDRMIDEELAALAAEREGIAASRAAVQKAILEVGAFQVDGKFSPDQYRIALQTQGYTPASFEKLIRDDLVRQAISSEIGASGLSTDGELDAYVRLSQQTRDIAYLDLPVPSLPAQPDEAALAAWHKANAARYQREETVAIEFVEIDSSLLEVPAAADEAALRKSYEDQKARFVTEPQYIASHILVAVPANADAKAETAARAKAQALADKARAPGADFAAIASESSEDLGSKDAGGDLGTIEKGLFDPAFEKALFALEQGQISDPVRSAEGWHVIQLREIAAGSSRSFEEVRPELEAEFAETERERLFNELSGRVIDQAYKDPTALEPAATLAGLPIQRTGNFTRGAGEGIAALEQVRKAAFADSQRIERQVSDAVEIAPGHVIVLRVIEHQPAATRPLAEVRDRALADLVADQLGKAAKAQGEALLARARKGESLEQIGKDVGRTVATATAIGRFSQDAPPSLVQEVFRLPRPDKKTGPEDVGLAKLADDRYALVTVTAVKDGDPASMAADIRTTMRQQLAQARGGVEFRAYLDALRKQYTVTVAEDRL